MEEIVRIENVKKFYGHIKALNGVSLNVPVGKIYGLIGPNGAGKTTLIRALTGSLKPDSGKIYALGMDPVRDKWKLRRDIGYMPQTYSLYEDLSAAENIAFFGRSKGVQDLKNKVNDILEFTELTERADDPVRTFSGGMKKRVSLACSLIHNPKILFLDEPTAAVDPHLKLRSWELFRELASKGVTLFISTHLMDEALLCDNVTVMRDGEIIASDTPRNILRKGKTKIRFISEGKEDMIEADSGPESMAAAIKNLCGHGSLSSVEVLQEDLESVILGMIKENRA